MIDDVPQDPVDVAAMVWRCHSGEKSESNLNGGTLVPWLGTLAAEGVPGTAIGVRLVLQDPVLEWYFWTNRKETRPPPAARCDEQNSLPSTKHAETELLAPSFRLRNASGVDDDVRAELFLALAGRKAIIDVQAILVEPPGIEKERKASNLSSNSPSEGNQNAAARHLEEITSERYSELDKAARLGGWKLHVSVKAPSAIEASKVASIAASAFEAPGIALLPSEGTFADSDPRLGVFERQIGSPAVSSETLARMIRLPSSEVPGLAHHEPLPFHRNAEQDGHGQVKFRANLGRVLAREDSRAGEFHVSSKTLNRHALICGATGSGKTETVKHLLRELHSNKTPWLVVEPAKSEYRRLRNEVEFSDLQVLRVGTPSTAAVGINPLQPAEGFPLSTHVDVLQSLFAAAFVDSVEPFPQILAGSLRKVYEDFGWELATGNYRRAHLSSADPNNSFPVYPQLSDLRTTAKAFVNDVGYARDVRQNVLGFIDVRLGSLCEGTPAQFFGTELQLDLGKMLQYNVVIELEDVGNDTDKAFLMGVLLVRLWEHLRQAGSSSDLKHVLVIEEAHRLLRNPGEGEVNQAVELFGTLLAEIRAAGEGVVIAEQVPTKILPDVLKNTALQIVHRMPSVTDRSIMSGTTNMTTEQSEKLASLQPGVAAAFREGMDRPVALQVPYTPPPKQLNSSQEVTISPKIVNRVLRSCTETCQSENLCSSIDFADADRIVEFFPHLEIWIESCFLMLAIGQSMPKPDEDWVSRFNAEHKEVNQGCLIERVVTNTVRCRWYAVARFTDPTLVTKEIRLHVEACYSGNSAHEQGSIGPIGGLAERLRMKLDNHKQEEIKASLSHGPAGKAANDRLLVTGADDIASEPRLDVLAKNWFGEEAEELLWGAVCQTITSSDRNPVFKALRPILYQFELAEGLRGVQR